MECGQPRSLVWLLFVLVLLASPPAAAEACGGLGRHLGGRQVLRGTVSKPMQSGDSESSVLKSWTHCSGVPQVGAALGSEAASGFVHRPVWSRRLLQLASGKAVHQDLSRRRQNLVRGVRIADSASATPPQVAAGSGGGASLNKGVIVIIVLVPSFFIIIMVATALAWMCRRTDTLDQQTRKPSFQGHVDEPDNANRALSFGPWLRSLNGTSIARKAGAPVPTAVELEYSLLQVATNDFSVENLLGEGGFGSVYKAQLDEKSFAAVKKLAEDSGQGEKEFQSEVDLMSKVRHPNLVSLLGFCTNGDDRLLVYEYMQNGSLQDQLHGPTKGSALGWHMRIKIALDAARGLEHLHEHCDPPVIHRDFKSSNILLDANFNAKVSDFGLALPMPSGLKKDTSLQLRGTFGYVAPEYFLTGALTEKSDVYGFGVVLLELLTGRTPVDTSKPIGCQSLVTWATPQLTIRSKLPLLLDPVLRDSMNIKHLYQVAAVAALCVQTEPSYRPLIADVVHSLVPLVPVEFGGALRTGDSGPDAKKNAVHAII